MLNGKPGKSSGPSYSEEFGDGVGKPTYFLVRKTKAGRKRLYERPLECAKRHCCTDASWQLQRRVRDLPPSAILVKRSSLKAMGAAKEVRPQEELVSVKKKGSRHLNPSVQTTDSDPFVHPSNKQCKILTCSQVLVDIDSLHAIFKDRGCVCHKYLVKD